MLLQLASLVLAAAAPRPPVQGTPPLQPETYLSPSGEWSLTIDPSSRFGAGPADYLVSKAGAPVWAKRLPFTLRRACIDERGFMAGHGYDEGWNGTTPLGNFVVAVVSPIGDVLAVHTWEMQGGLGIHSAPKPWVIEPVLDSQRGHVVFRVSTHDGKSDFEEWRIVDLENGSLIDTYRPDERAKFPTERRADVVDMLPISGTDLYAVCWRTLLAPEDWPVQALSVTVQGPDGVPVASVDLPQEFDVPGDSGPSRNLWKEIWRHGLFLPSEVEASFGLWLPKSAVRVDYGVKPLPSDGQWMIEELGRKPYEPPEASPVEDPISEAIDLPLLERVELKSQSPPVSGPIRDIAAFGSSGPGRFQVVRCDDSSTGSFSCLVIDEQGTVLFERALEPLGGDEQGRWSWWPLDGGRWLATPSSFLSRPTPQAVLIDATDVEPLRRIALHDDRFENVARMPDGGFVVLAGSTLACYDAAGVGRWFKWLDGEVDDPQRLFGANDVAVSPSGLIAVVDPWQAALALFATDGAFVERLELEELWDHKPVYVSEVEALGEGFLVVEDPSSPIVHRLSRDGRIQSSFVPRHADGSKEVALARNTQVASDGRLWTTDGRTLQRLGDDGLADLVLGQERSIELLTKPMSAHVGPCGRVAILDAVTRALHVFDQAGTEVYVAAPAPGDFEGHTLERKIAAAFDGRFFLQTTAHEAGWMEYGAGGERRGPINLKGSSKFDTRFVAFSPEGNAWVHCIEDHESAALRGRDHEELARVARKLDRRWFEDLVAFAVAPSGGIAALEQLPFSIDGPVYGGGRGAVVSWFDSNANPVGQVALSTTHEGDSIAHSGSWVAVSSYEANAIWLVQTSTRRLLRMAQPEGWVAAMGFSPDGRELWLVLPEDLILLKLALP